MRRAAGSPESARQLRTVLNQKKGCRNSFRPTLGNSPHPQSVHRDFRVLCALISVPSVLVFWFFFCLIFLSFVSLRSLHNSQLLPPPLIHRLRKKSRHHRAQNSRHNQYPQKPKRRSIDRNMPPPKQLYPPKHHKHVRQINFVTIPPVPPDNRCPASAQPTLPFLARFHPRNRQNHQRRAHSQNRHIQPVIGNPQLHRNRPKPRHTHQQNSNARQNPSRNSRYPLRPRHNRRHASDRNRIHSAQIRIVVPNVIERMSPRQRPC